MHVWLLLAASPALMLSPPVARRAPPAAVAPRRAPPVMQVNRGTYPFGQERPKSITRETTSTPRRGASRFNHRNYQKRNNPRSAEDRAWQREREREWYGGGGFNEPYSYSPDILRPQGNEWGTYGDPYRSNDRARRSGMRVREARDYRDPYTTMGRNGYHHPYSSRGPEWGDYRGPYEEGRGGTSLTSMVQVLKRELGLTGSMHGVVRKAAEELMVPIDPGEPLLEQARACMAVLGRGR